MQAYQWPQLGNIIRQFICVAVLFFCFVIKTALQMPCCVVGCNIRVSADSIRANTCLLVRDFLAVRNSITVITHSSKC